MYINNINILDKFNAIVTKRDFQACNVVTISDWLENSYSPTVNSQKERYSLVTVGLIIEDDKRTENEILIDISNLIKMCEKGRLSFNDLSFSYDVVLDKHQETLICEFAYEIVLTFKTSFKLLGMQEITLDTSTTNNVYNYGNTIAPVTLEIEPFDDDIDIVISGLSEEPITIKNLHKDKKIILDSIKGTITEDGANKFEDVDLWEFPALLKTEYNTVTFDRNNCNVTLKYEPRLV